jgi:hypothetical protein
MGRDDLLSEHPFPDAGLLLFHGVDDSVSFVAAPDRPETTAEMVSCFAPDSTTDKEALEDCLCSNLLGVDDYDLVVSVSSAAPWMSAAAATF